jgi:hypothetical protein
MAFSGLREGLRRPRAGAAREGLAQGDAIDDRSAPEGRRGALAGLWVR